MQTIITIDGPSGAGKASAAQLVAKHFGVIYVPSGKLFRAASYLITEQHIDVDDREALTTLLDAKYFKIHNGRIYYKDADISDKLHTVEVGMRTTLIARYQNVRTVLLELQRQLGKGGCVIDGRSTALEVFPDATLKVWLTADEKIRQERKRHSEGEASAASILIRDEMDKERQLAPMQQTEDAVVIDTTHISPRQVADNIIQAYQKKLAA